MKTTINRISVLLVLAMLMLAGWALAGQKKTKTTSAAGQNTAALDRQDSRFLVTAAEGGMAEVQLGKLATEKASNPDVKAFGQRMVDDHSKANDELKQVASSKGVTLPTALSAKDQATADRLSKLSGAQFDRAYMTEMVKDHKKDVAEFERQANAAKDPDVKAFAGKTAPTLREHLKMATDTHAKVAGGGGTKK